MEVGRQAHVPAAMPPGKVTRYALCRRLGRLQGWSGQVRKISPPPGFHPQTVHPVAIRCTVHTIPAQAHVIYQSIYSEAISRFSFHCGSFLCRMEYDNSNGYWAGNFVKAFFDLRRVRAKQPVSMKKIRNGNIQSTLSFGWPGRFDITVPENLMRRKRLPLAGSLYVKNYLVQFSRWTSLQVFGVYPFLATDAVYWQSSALFTCYAFNVWLQVLGKLFSPFVIRLWIVGCFEDVRRREFTFKED